MFFVVVVDIDVCVRAYNTIDVCVTREGERERPTCSMSEDRGCHTQAYSSDPTLLYSYIIHTQLLSVTHTDKIVSIIHAYSHNYATVNPSVLPWC